MLELQLKSEFLIAKQFSHDRDFNSAHVQGFHLQLFQQYMMVQDCSVYVRQLQKSTTKLYHTILKTCYHQEFCIL